MHPAAREDHPVITDIIRGIRTDEEHALDSGKGAIVVACIQIDGLQVRQQAHENVALRGRPEIRILQLHAATINAIEQLLRLVLETDLAILKRIDEQLDRFSIVPDQKVTRKVHALERQVQTPADLQIDDAQRDRYPELAIQHVVEERVTRI